jgi:hypothetical protein
MSDWTQEVALAEAEAGRLQAAEDVAEQQFDAVHSQAQANGDKHAALKSPEFDAWMSARRATDAAWGAWSLIMDARPRQEA